MSIIYLIVGAGSALVSGMTGLAGGVLLLSYLSLTFPIEVVIPIHALVQVLANLSRVILLRSQINWEIWKAFNLFTIPAGLLGAYGVSFLPQQLIKSAVGVVVIFAALYTAKKTYFGHRSIAESSQKKRRGQRRYVVLGAISSLLGMVVGATGPLIAPFFMMDGLKRERFIATKSACQLTVQVIKTVIFAQILNFSYTDYSVELSLIVLGVFFGTWVAKKMLAKVRGSWLEMIITIMLLVIGSRLLIGGLSAIGA